MKKVFPLLCFLAFANLAFAQNDNEAALIDSLEMLMQNTEAAMKYQTGKVDIQDIATLNIPAGFKFLDAAQSEKVLTELWGNPPNSGALGMILPEKGTVTGEDTWAFIIQYDEMGYVKDDDADKINYDDLLKDLQSEEPAENELRKKEGFEEVHIVGWAQKPFYDKDKKILHWAKEIKFGTSPDNTLNYNVRVLGRKGVLVLNAVGSMGNLAEVNQEIGKVLSIVNFKEGNQYKDFDPNVDEIAAWSIGGLVAGKLLAKAGLFALLLKNIKLVGLALVAGGSYLWSWISGRRRKEEEEPEVETVANETETPQNSEIETATPKEGDTPKSEDSAA